MYKTSQEFEIRNPYFTKDQPSNLPFEERLAQWFSSYHDRPQPSRDELDADAAERIGQNLERERAYREDTELDAWGSMRDTDDAINGVLVDAPQDQVPYTLAAANRGRQVAGRIAETPFEKKQAVKLSEVLHRKPLAAVQAAVYGEAVADAFFREALDVYKVSASQPGGEELCAFLEQGLTLLSEMKAPGIETDSLEGIKLSSVTNTQARARAAWDEMGRQGYFHEITLAQGPTPLEKTSSGTLAPVSMQKQSFLGDFIDGLTSPARDALTMRAHNFGRTPYTQGYLGASAPFLDFRAGKKLLDPESTSGRMYRYFTPEQRYAKGFYFEDDLAHLARTLPVSVTHPREAVLAGAQRGIQRANEYKPGLFDKLRLKTVEGLAERTAYKAQMNRIRGAWPGILGTLEEASTPTLRDSLGERAANLGSSIRRLPLGVKLLAGGGAALGAGYGLRLLGRKHLSPPVALTREPNKEPQQEE